MRPPRLLFRALLSVVGIAGCGSSDNDKVIEDAQGQNCSGTTYVAFDPKNHAAQDQRVQIHAAFRTKLEPAATDPTKAPSVFAEIEGLYASTADLRVEVQGLADQHFPDDANSKSVGKQIDQAITGAIARGKAATAPLDVKIAGHIVDEALTRFFFLYVFHELSEGERPAYDEGYGTLGTGATNDPQKLLSLAALASEIDGLYQTDYEKKLFDDIREGSCQLDKALREHGGDSVDWKTNEAYGTEVREIDGLLTEVLARAVVHEFTELADQQNLDDATEELYEGAFYFFAIDAAMRGKGGMAATDATDIAASLNGVMNDIDSGDPTWKGKIDAGSIGDRVSKAFGF